MTLIREIPRPTNFSKLVQTLKQGPNFGIHGALPLNAQEMLAEMSPAAIDHYFSIDARAKAYSDVEFYNKLFASVNVALGHSSSLINSDSGISFREGLPCLVLGIPKNKKYDYLILGDSSERYSGISDEKGNPVSTFRVGHDFLRDYLDIRRLDLSEQELEDIKRKVNAKCPLQDLIGQAYLGSRQLTRVFVSKIYEAIRNLKK